MPLPGTTRDLSKTEKYFLYIRPLRGPPTASIYKPPLCGPLFGSGVCYAGTRCRNSQVVSNTPGWGLALEPKDPLVLEGPGHKFHMFVWQMVPIQGVLIPNAGMVVARRWPLCRLFALFGAHVLHLTQNAFC